MLLLLLLLATMFHLANISATQNIPAGNDSNVTNFITNISATPRAGRWQQ